MAIDQNIQDPTTQGTGGIDGLKGLSARERARTLSPVLFELTENFRPVTKEIMLQTVPKEEVGFVGVGDSRYDKKISSFTQLQDLDNTRGELQPGYIQLLSGIAKGGVLAGTTFADGIAGTIVGVGNLLAGGEDGKTQFSDFWNNPFSQAMQKINKWSEEVLPNYYTNQEKEEPWYNNIFTANFIGDKFLKNVGFAVGAAYSGRVNAMGVSKILGLNKARQAFKGAVTAAGETLTSPSEVLNAYRMGDATLDGIKLTDDLARNAKKLVYGNPTLKITGAMTGAMGEARIEAINNSKDWFDLHKTQLDNHRKGLIDQEITALMQEYPEAVTAGFNEAGSIVPTPAPELLELAEQRVNQKFDYNAGLSKITADRLKMGNVDFLLNVPLLTASDAWQFGKFYAGGYKAAKKTANIVRTLGADGKAVYSAVKPSRWADAAKIASKGLAEGPVEEMGQAAISKMSGYKYAADLNSFYGAKIDPEEEANTIDWMQAAGKALAQTYGTAEGWEEGFIGGLTGLMGIPGFRSMKNSEGKMQSPIYMQGGMKEDIQEISQRNKENQTLVSAMNQRVQSPEFLNYYQSAIRHNKFESAMNKAADKNDQFSFKNAEHSQLINDVVMFEKAGRIQDFYDMIEEAGTIKPEDVEEIRNLATNKETGKSIYDGMTDQEVIEQVRKRAEDTKKDADRYREISDNLKTQIGDVFQGDELEELTWMMSSVDNLEKRFKDIHQELRKSLEPILNVSPQTTMKNAKGEEIPVRDILTMSPGQLLQELSGEKSELNDFLNQALVGYRQEGRDVAQQVGQALADLARWKRSRAKDRKVNLDKATQLLGELSTKAAELTKKGAAIDIKKTQEQIGDLARIAQARVDFIDKYNGYLKNPEALRNSIREQQKSALNAYMDKAVNSTVDSIEKVSTPKAVKEILGDVNAEILPEVLKRIKQGDNEKVKELINNYQAIQSMQDSMDKLYKDAVKNPVFDLAKQEIDKAIQEGETLEDVLKILDGKVVQLDKPVADVIVDSIKQYKKLEQSRKVDDPDKKPKKQGVINKIKQKFSLFGAADTPEADAGTEDAEETPSKKKTKVDEEEEEVDDDVDEALSEPPVPDSVEYDINEDDIIAELEDMNGDELIGITKGLVKFKDVSEANYKIIQKLAQGILEKRVAPPAVEDSNELVVPEDARKSDTGTFRSWVETKYDFNSLKDFRIRKKVLRENSIVKLLDEFGAFDFVDNGNLATLLKQNRDLKIHYILGNDQKFLNDDGYPLIFLAVEINKETLRKVNFPHSLEGNDGKRYQVVGALGYQANDAEAQKNYLGIFKGLKKEIASGKELSVGQFFVSQKYSNRVKHLYSGRMVKSSETDPGGKRDLDQTFMGSNEPHFGVFIDTNRGMVTPSLDEYQEVVPLNLHNGNPKNGSVWLMTKAADGRYYPKAVQIKRFTKNEYDLNKYGNTPLLQTLRSNLEIITDPSQSAYKRSLAKFAVEEIFYFAEGGPRILFNGDVVSISELTDNIGKGLAPKEKAQALLEALQSDELSLRFQVKPSKLNDTKYSRDILNSAILTTDLLQPNNVNASFDMYLNDLETGQWVDDGMGEDMKGHTGSRETNPKLQGQTIQKAGERYLVKANGEISLNGTAVTDQNTLEEVTLMAQVANGTATPYPGSRHLYIGKYSLTGQEFGVLNGWIKTGDTLEKLKETADERTKKQKKTQKINKVIQENAEVLESEDMGDAKEGVFGKLKFSTVEEKVPETPEPVLSQTPTRVLDENFVNDGKGADWLKENNEPSDFRTLAKGNVRVLKELNFNKISEFEAFVKDPANKLPSIESINSPLSFAALIKTIRDCR